MKKVIKIKWSLWFAVVMFGVMTFLHIGALVVGVLNPRFLLFYGFATVSLLLVGDMQIAILLARFGLTFVPAIVLIALYLVLQDVFERRDLKSGRITDDEVKVIGCLKHATIALFCLYILPVVGAFGNTSPLWMLVWWLISALCIVWSAIKIIWIAKGFSKQSFYVVKIIYGLIVMMGLIVGLASF